MNPSAALRQQALAQPDHPAILWEGGVLTYGAFEDRVSRMAGGLVARLAPGSRIALVMENCPEFLPALYAIWRAGMVAVPINARLHAREHAWILENAEATLTLASPALGEKLTAVNFPNEILTLKSREWDALEGPPITETTTSPDNLAWLFYTSGTTGRPKGAMITHRNLMAAAWAYCTDVDFIGPNDIRLHAAPLTHGSGLYAVPFVLKGAQNLILPGGFRPEDIFDVLATRQNVSFFAAPTMVSRLINHPLALLSDHPGLKTLEYGGAPMYLADLKRALEVFGPRLYQVYGQGEAPMTISHTTKAMHADACHPRYWERLATVGTPRSGCEVRIMGPDGPLPMGETGEIATRSDVVVPGYWKNPEATARAIRDGWLMTGDVGSLDDEGFLIIKDRSKDMVISGGMNIYPREIEEVLLTHPGVTECSVVGRPDPDWGEALVAFVVGTATVADLDRLCLDNLARFKRPKEWRLIDALPKNNYGKIVKTDLRALLEAED
ncbi:MAG: AMP-binding protein [Pseudomonadota bacterium]